VRFLTLITTMAVAILVASCQPEISSESFTEQEERVKKATTEYEAEKTRLISLKDSLTVRIEENLKLGMAEEKAMSVENALIQVQETVVAASEIHMIQQKEVLALMKTGQN
jgi:hypothetical protein